MLMNQGRADEAADKLRRVLEAHPGRSPLDTLLDARPQDIVLLLRAGRTQFGDDRFAQAFETGDGAPQTSTVSVVAQPKRIVGDPVGLMQMIWEKIDRRYTGRHEYQRSGRYRIRVTLSQRGDKIASQSMTIDVRPGVGDPTVQY